MAAGNSIRDRGPRDDLTGHRFGKLIVERWAGRSRWHCSCDCGGTAVVLTANLKRGNTGSCGCIRRCKSSKRATKHGLSNTDAYRTWLSIRRRCHGKDGGHGYRDYGARGITVCDEWRNSVEAFVRDVGQPPHGMTLDRIDNYKGYEPGNVRWATVLDQARNKRNNIVVDFQGMRFRSISEFLEWLAPQINVNRRSLARELQKRLRP